MAKDSSTQSTSSTDTTSESSLTWMDKIKASLGALVIIGLGLMIVILFNKLDTYGEIQWTRAVYLLSGVEAIAFAAAGYFFGTEVNRVRAEKAEDDAEKQGQKADEKEKETQQAKDEEAKSKAEVVKIKSGVSELSRSLEHRLAKGNYEILTAMVEKPSEQGSILADIKRINELVK